MNKRGQSIIEYAVILGLVVAGLTAMQVYVKRGIQAGIKVAADELGPQEKAEELDPQKGTKAYLVVNTKTAGGTRVRGFKGGKQRIDIGKASVSSGVAVYVKEELTELPTPPAAPPMPPPEIEWPPGEERPDQPPPYYPPRPPEPHYYYPPN